MRGSSIRGGSDGHRWRRGRPGDKVGGMESKMSSRIYVIDTEKNLRAPQLHKVVEPADIEQKTGLAFQHTSHCLASGEIMVSCLGDKDGNAAGSGFLLLDSEFNVKGRNIGFPEEIYQEGLDSEELGGWEKPCHSPAFGYDFWYQPRHKTMISSSWGAPSAFRGGFNLQHVSDGLYGRHLNVYSWPDGELKQTLDLGNTGLLPLETRFLHDPSKDTGFVGSALSSNMVKFFKTSEGSWDHEVVISVQPLKVKNWILPEMPGLITDFLISLDDQYLYFVNWLHGDVRQYNIEDPKKPVLSGQVWKGSAVIAEAEDGTELQFEVPAIQFYPEIIEKGSHMLQINVDTEKGGLTVNPNFFVDFGNEPDGPSLAHENEEGPRSGRLGSVLLVGIGFLSLFRSWGQTTGEGRLVHTSCPVVGGQLATPGQEGLSAWVLACQV
ncbi:Selenium-binding protein 1 [Acorus calamus]|uniref:Selenium-binding protein 1 n=1 Tax=Acorus calamus TaxID=4465 RepID=A0AAV9F2T2_ACOCL|nr:Selenium-binding protein 1 [Acorus calamus]